jgi:hypothetical protein
MPRLPSLPSIGIVLIVIAAIAGAFWWHGAARYAAGRAEEKAVWVEASRIEAARQKAINASADRLQQQAIAELQKRNADLSALLEANDAEAAKDPRAAAPALGRDSVRRLNAVR